MDNNDRSVYDALFNLDTESAWELIKKTGLDRIKHNCLPIAYHKGDFELFKRLIDNGASVFNYNEITTVSNFITFDRLDKMEYFVYAFERVKDVNEFDSQRFINPLLFCCYRGMYDCVNWLIEHGADVNVIDAGGRTPFFNACRNGNVEVVKLILSCEPHGIYNATVDGYSAIKYAQSERKTDVVRFLIRSGYNLERVPDLYNFLFEMALTRDEGTVREVISRGLDITKVKYCENQFVKELKEQGAKFYTSFVQELKYLLDENRTTPEIYKLFMDSINTNNRTPSSDINNNEIEVVKVKYFPSAYKEYTFLANGFDCKPGDVVIVNTNNKIQEVIITKGNYKTDLNDFNFELKKIMQKR